LKIKDDEYRRGIISWDIAGPVTVCVRDPSHEDTSDGWSAPLIDPNGSLSPIPLVPGVEIAVVAGDPSTLEQPFRVRWQALLGEEVVTAVWDALDSSPILVMEMPGLGTFHRIKIATPYLAWEEEARIWQHGTSLTFEHVEEEGQVMMPVEPTPPGELPKQLTAVPAMIRQGTIEIVASGPTPPAAATQASALLGFLALIMGNEAIGPVLHRQAYEVTPDETCFVLHAAEPITQEQMIRPVLGVAVDVIDLIDKYLPFVLGVGRPPLRADALRVALSAYERASRSYSVLERFLAYFIGVEGIATAYADESRLRGVFAALQDDPRLSEFLASLTGEYKVKDLERLRKSLGRPSNPERFGHYAKAHGIGKNARRSFHCLNGLRNMIAHGSSIQVGLEDVTAAKELLVEVLKSEIGLPSPLPWESLLQIEGLSISGTPTAPTACDWLSEIHLRVQETI
jgi:hypothetical protein